MNSFAQELANQLFYSHPTFYILIILTILIIIFYKKIIGFAGEHWVRQELRKLPSDYKIINNLLFKLDDKTHQVDHVVISKYGIFVIETKQINGYITGNDFDKTWRVKAGNKIYYMYNPLHQNYGHVISLKDLLVLDEKIFKPYVCISSNAKVKVNSKQVLELYNLVPTILEYKEEILPNYIDIYNKLLEYNIKDKKIVKEHIKSAKITKSNREKNMENKCPLCGGVLVNRNSTYGNFLGCSNYPKCKYIKK